MSKYRNNNNRSAGQQFAARAAVEFDGPEQQLKLDTPSDKKLANILYKQDRGHLYEFFAQKFEIKMEPYPQGDTVKFNGSSDAGSRAKRGFAMLSGMVESGTYIDKSAISSIAAQVNAGSAARKASNSNAAGGIAFEAKNETQQLLADTIDANDLVFALGPAGTGKTHVAVLKAVEALKAGTVKKIILARPAQEAGEKLGFQPGDLAAKLKLYMLPMYDILDQAYGQGGYKGLMDSGAIELSGVGFMRGRTFKDSFIIVDEAQNMTLGQLKMAMTRIGEGSKMIVTGDPNQSDISNSGLQQAYDLLKGKEGVGSVQFNEGGVVRSKIAQTVVTAFEGITVDDLETSAKAKPGAVSKPTVEDDLPPPPKAPGNQGPSNPRY